MNRTTSARAGNRWREFAHLRARAEGLREQSRNLRARSVDARQRLNLALDSLREAKRLMAARSAASEPRVHRLLRAEADLESAIAECGVALREVRRELGWQDDGPAPRVH